MTLRRSLAAPLTVAAALAALTACGAAPEPTQPAPTASASPVSASPITAQPSSAQPSSAQPSSAQPSSAQPSASPSVGAGLTLQQLGFDNGPKEFTLPPGSVISTSVDQPNVVTVVLSSPGPETVDSYLRSTLPDEGFTIDARSMANGALTFKGNGWTGGFTGTGTSSAIVLRPA